MFQGSRCVPLKFLGFSGLKAIFVGLKTVVFIKGAFVARLMISLDSLVSFTTCCYYAAIAAVGYALYNAFEVEKI